MGDDAEELTRVGHRSPALWIGGWVVGLLAVAGLALAGRGSTEPTATPPAIARATGDVASATAPDPDRETAGILVTRPTIDGGQVTAARLMVVGTATDPDRPLKISLYNMWGDELAGTGVLARGEFTVVLRIPDPRPIGPAVLQVRRVDPAGREAMMVERPLVIGPLAVPPPPVERPSLGEDGLVGGLVFGTAWPPAD